MSQKSNINILNIPHRFFGDNITHNTLVDFSSCIVPVGLILQTLVEIKMFENNYVLCPIYSRKVNGKEVVSDIQIGVTGKAKYGEPQIMAVNREIGEELGVVVPYDCLSNINCIDPPMKTMFWISASKTVSANYEIENSIDTPWKNAKDDRDKRVCVCIVGDMNEVTKLIEDESFSFRYNGFEKDIVGMCAVPISHALEYVKSKKSGQITSIKRNNKSRSRSGKK